MGDSQKRQRGREIENWSTVAPIRPGFESEPPKSALLDHYLSCLAGGSS